MDFDRPLDRIGTSSIKWDYVGDFCGKNDVVPMWVADSDFEVPEEVKEVLKKRADHGAFGYTAKSKRFYNSIINWIDKKYNWQIVKDNIVSTPGVVAAINWAVHVFTNEGDKIIIQPPVYYPFYDAIEENNRTLVENNLVLKDGKYYMDFDDLKSNIDKDTKMIILCSPHNPVTRVWTKDELKELGEICTNNNVLIISDEIHSDLILEGNVHTPIATISKEIAENTITLMAPSKTFNVAGLELSTAIITNDKLKKKFTNFQRSIGVGARNIFSIEAFIACYEYGENWLEEQLKYIKGNIEYVKKYIKDNMVEINVIDPEGTYLLWVDCSALKFNDDQLNDFFVNKVNVALDMGIIFGKKTGKDYVRFNLATQREIIEGVMNKFKQQYDIRMRELT